MNQFPDPGQAAPLAPPLRRAIPIRRILTWVLLLLAGAHLFSSLPWVIKAIEDYRLSLRMEDLNQASNHLVAAIRYLGYERGRAYVEMFAPRDTQDAAAGRASIANSRREGEAALARAMEYLAGSPSSTKLAASMGALAMARERVAALRGRVDEGLGRELDARDLALPDPWLEAMDDMFGAMEDVLADLSLQASQARRGFTRLAVFRLAVFGLRNAAGPETALLSAVMATGRPIAASMANRIISLRGQAQQHLHTLFHLTGSEGPPQLLQALQDFQSAYQANIPEVDRVLAAANQAGPYHITRQELLARGRAILERVSRLTDVAVALWSEDAQRLQQEAWQALIWPLASTGLVLAFILAGLVGVLRYVADPVSVAMAQSQSLLASTLESTADGILVADGKGKMVLWNQKFAQMWGLSHATMASGDDQAAIAEVLSQLKDPASFVAKVQELYSQPQASSLDQLEFKDGRVFERNSQPHRIGERIVGRVWSFRDVTERSQAQRRVGQSEARLALASSLARVGYWDWTLSSDELVWTDEVYRIFGYEPGQVTPSYQLFMEHVAQEDRERVNSLVTNSLTQPVGYEAEFRFQRRDGATRSGRAVGQAQFNQDGQATRLSGAMQDITEIRRAEEDIKQRERQFRVLLENTRSIPFAFDFASDRFTYIGPQVEAVLGYPRQSWQGFLSWADRIDPRDRAEAVEFCQSETSQGRDHEFSYRMVAANGDTVWIQDMVSVVMGPQGPLGLVGFMRDITAQKLAEQALKESERKYRFLVESAGVVVWRGVPGSFQFAFVSEEAERLLGYPARQWVEDPDFWVNHLHPEDREAAQRACLLAGAAGQAHQFDYRMLAADGREVWVRDIVSFEIEDGRVTGVVGVLVDITDRKRAEARLAELAAIVASSQESIVSIDHQGIIISWNLGAQRLYGYSDQEAVGKHISLLVPEGHVDRGMGYLARALAGETVEQYETVRKAKDGRLIDLSITLSPLLDATGAQVGVSAIARDISLRKRAEQALRESERRHRDLVEGSFDGIMVQQGDRIIFANSHLHQILGYSEGELAGMEFWKIYHPDYRSLVMERAQARLRGEVVPSRYEVKAQRKDGSSLEAEISARAISLEGGAGIQVWLRDISERKRGEQALRESEENYRSLFELSPYAVVIHVEGKIVLANDAGAKLLSGQSGQDIIGRDLIAQFILPEQREMARQRARLILDSGLAMPVVEYRFQCLDGSVIEVEATGKAINFGGRVAIMSLYRDVTQSKQAAEDRARLEAQLRQAQKMEAIGTLAGGIAHDFNNILAVVLGFTELAQQLAAHGQDNSEELAQVLRATERARNLVQQILAFSRKAEIKPQPISLNRYVTHTVELLGRTLPKMISIQTHLEPSLGLTNADPTQMEQVLMNLTINAADAIGEGGQVVIQTENALVGQESDQKHPGIRPGQYVLLRVADNGHGMDAQTVNRIFEPFFTTKGVGKGTGLGLSTAYGIVKSHEGFIYCRSQPGQGTVFEVFLPAFDLEALAPPLESRQPERLPLGSERVLLVDDEAAILDLGQRLLEGYGYQVRTASRGEQALEIYREQEEPIDLVIMELGMPGMGGHRALKAILELDPRARVIIASGYAANDQVRAAMASGAVAFVAKPFKRADLLTTVRSALDRA